jgi:acetate kinase
MRKTLVINSGSSSLKFKLYTMPGYIVDCEGIVDRIGIEGSNIVIKTDDQKVTRDAVINDHETGINLMLEIFEEINLIENKDQITKVGHRVVQGGEIFKESAKIEEKELEQIYELAKLAPLHNKPNGDGIKVFRNLLPDAVNVAVFDTEFHQSMPPESYMYALPYEWYEKYQVRRYGMHGTSHKYIANKVAEIEGRNDLKIINCHLGNGASVCAIKDGMSVQTSMGLTPLAGVMMGTRSGDIDPSIIEYISKATGLNLEEITDILNKKSGMLGLSELSSDFRDIEDAMEEGHVKARMGMDVYVARLVETIGSYIARLGGVDVINFTGGVGENGSIVREEVLNQLSFLGIEVVTEINDNRKIELPKVITTADSKVKAYVIATDEEYQIASEAEKF